MNINKKITVWVKDGKPTKESGPAIWSLFDKAENGRYEMVLNRKTHRTLNQNSFLHALFTLAQRGFYDIGYRQVKTMEDAKEILKQQFLSVTYNNPKNGQKLNTVRHTSSLTKEEAMVFIDECIQFCSEYLSVVVPSLKNIGPTNKNMMRLLL